MPKGWIEQQQLVKGDPLFINERPESLTITAQPRSGGASIVEERLDGRDELDILRRKIVTAYVNNAKRVVIENPGEKVQQIREIIHGLIALEIAEQSSEHILAQDYLDLAEIKPDELLRQIDNDLRAMFCDLLAFVALEQTQRDARFATDMDSRDDEINRLNLLNIRALKHALRTASADPISTLRTWEITQVLEKIGDELKRLARVAAKEGMETPEGFVGLLRATSETYHTTMDAYYAGRIQTIYELTQRKAPLMEQSTTLLRRHKGTYALSRFLFHQRVLIQYISTLIRMAYQ